MTGAADPLPTRLARLSPAQRRLLELRLEQQNGPRPAARIPLVRQTERTSFPLSFAQERMWVLQQFEPQSPVYNRPASLRLRGVLEAAALEQALNAVVERHEVLRATVRQAGGRLSQSIAPFAPFALPVRQLPPGSDRAAEEQLQAMANAEAQQPFDLEKGPLFRAELVRMAPEDHALLLTFHHAVFDGWSAQVLRAELAVLYGAALTGLPPSLPDLPIQYGDLACWQRQWLQGEVLASELDYWRHRLAGASAVLELPTDWPRPPVLRSVGAHQTCRLSAVLTRALKELSQREGVTLFVTLLAGLAAVLSRRTGQEDLVVGVPVAARTRPQTEKLIGCLINTLALRTDLTGNPTARQLLQRTQHGTLADLAHQDLPFAAVVADRGLPRDLSRPPLCQVLCQLRNVPRTCEPWPGLQVEPLPASTGTAKVDLSLDAEDLADGLRLDCEYNTDLFRGDTIARMLGHLEVLLGGMAADPGTRLADLPVLTAAERHQVLVGWNSTATAYPRDRCVHVLFEEQVVRTPDAVAVEFADQRATYAELNRRANRLAHRLQALGVGPGVPVGLGVERSVHMVVGLLGILKAGGAYLPLDGGSPRARLTAVMEDSRTRLTVTTALAAGAVPEVGERVLLEDLPDGLAEANPEVAVLASDLAYVLYTSGSTGQPKGVAVEHRNLANFLGAMPGVLGLGSGDTVLAVTTLSFDIAALEILLPLVIGARVVLADEDMRTDPAALAAAMETHAATVLQATPSSWQLLQAAGWPGRAALKALCGGETLSAELAEWILPRVASLWNLYGPTETTVWSTVGRVLPGQQVTIGAPIANTRIYLVDHRGNPVPVGVPGELWIGGDGVARGYLNQPELTAERFIEDPFRGDAGARVYRSGDIGRWQPDGSIEFIGRRDQQVKLRGHRLELGEVEAALERGAGVRQAAVVVREEEPGDQRLVAYVVLGGALGGTLGSTLGGALGSTAAGGGPAEPLRRSLRQVLPEWMVPSAFVVLDSLPLTPNGKVDRRALAGARPAAARPAVAARRPLTCVEGKLAEIWQDLLGTGPFDPGDSFFARGGHSLLATVLVSRVRDTLGVELPLRTVFEQPALTELAGAVERLQTTAAPAPPPIRARARTLRPQPPETHAT